MYFFFFCPVFFFFEKSSNLEKICRSSTINTQIYLINTHFHCISLSPKRRRAKANSFANFKRVKAKKKKKRVIANTLFQQNKRQLYTWTLPDGQYWNQSDYILCSRRWRSFIQSAKPRLGADCGSDHELLIAKFWLKLKKVGKTTRPFRYDLNQPPYDYTVEVTNRFKGLHMIDRMPEELQMFVTLYRRQWPRSSPRKRNAKRQNGCLRRPYK